MNELLGLSGTELARRIRARELSSLAAVDAHIDHLSRVNPAINAAVELRFAAAREEARRADERVASEAPEALPPLLGVPCTIKEVFAFAGMRQTSGLVSRRHHVASADAPTVRRLRAAGAIPIATTNVSELCMWLESSNKVYGRTNNPYDLTRIAGGSSGGEGAVIAAGASPFGLGSDIAGSIRLPAFFNGVFGHKPTGGLVPGTGQHPIAENEALRYLTTGPLARRAADLMPLLAILAGPDGEDRMCRAMPLGDPDAVDIAGLRVLNVTNNGRVPVRPDLIEAQQRAANALARRGAQVSEVTIEGLARSFDVWSAMLDAASETPFSALMGGGVPIAAGRELLRWAFGRSDHTLPALGLALLEKLNKVSSGRIRRALRAGRALRAELVRRLGPDGVMLYPTYGAVAPRHNLALLPPFRWTYTAILNVMELPVTQVPLGLNAEGLPLGVQVVATHGHDHVTIAVACALEAACGGWVPPPRIFGGG